MINTFAHAEVLHGEGSQTAAHTWYYLLLFIMILTLLAAMVAAFRASKKSDSIK